MDGEHQECGHRFPRVHPFLHWGLLWTIFPETFAKSKPWRVGPPAEQLAATLPLERRLGSPGSRFLSATSIPTLFRIHGTKGDIDAAGTALHLRQNCNHPSGDLGPILSHKLLV